ncbi:MAG: WbqC family protein [Lachnospiraceae bacterium]|nr:WbqC family protein [Lachnospiraceae bacterium]
MNLAIMQPYFLPYIGYWQLLYAVDTFVIYDDVNYIKKGWINRNRLLEGGKPAFFQIDLKHVSQNKYINETERYQDMRQQSKLLKRIAICYKKALFFEEIYPIIEHIILDTEMNLAKYLENSIRYLADYLDIQTNIINSSGLKKDRTLKGQEKIIDICKRLDAERYYNAIGGTSLYNKEIFSLHGIELRFLESLTVDYVQFNNEFIPSLSILDVLMFNGKEKTKEYLTKFRFV